MGTIRLIKMKKILNIIFCSLILLNIISAEENAIGNIIPDLKIRLLDGSTTTIHELVKDGPLMIDFWATWCVNCKKLMKYLNFLTHWWIA